MIFMFFRSHVYLPGPTPIWNMLVVCKKDLDLYPKCPPYFDLNRNVSIFVPKLIVAGSSLYVGKKVRTQQDRTV